MGKHYSRIGKQYSFSAAHQLPRVPDGHPCKRVHGHNYVVEIEVRGDTQPNGFCNGLDFYEIDKHFKPLVDRLDHQNLNDFIDNPTAENIARWLMDEVALKFIYSVTVWETPKCWAMAVNADGLFAKANRD
ncbi:MAG: 6-carboxytetrahydropterin synthase [Rhizobiales bacterium]|nr:6-carboxytetrahydropterin synthase [Hyphomicrobiales bacterium]